MSALPFPPEVSGFPLIGNSLEFLLDPQGFLLDAHARHGPVFRVTLGLASYTVLAGEEARQFYMKNREAYFSREAFYRDFAKELGSDYFVLSAPEGGGKHPSLRRMMRLAFSREVAGSHVPAMIESARSEIGEWHPGSTFKVMEVMARMTFRQYGFVMAERDFGSLYTDARLYAQTIMDVGTKARPKALLLQPSYQSAKRRIFAAMREVLAELRARPPKAGGNLTVLSSLLGAGGIVDETITDETILSSALYGFVGTIVYMNRVLAFLLYDLAKNPHAMEQVAAEAATAFADGVPDLEGLRRMTYLRAALTESLRRHPIAFALPFCVERDFEFHGHRVAKGQLVIITSVPNHFSCAHYRDPWKFEPERCLGNRNEHKAPGAYAPFGMGNRVCSAVGLIETIALTTIATMFSSVELELERPSYALRTIAGPLPGPEASFTLRVVGRRSRPTAAIKKPDEDAALPDVDASERKQLVESMELKTFPASSVIIRKGDEADAFYVLVDGEVEVVDTRPDGTTVPLRRLSAGNHFGEVGLLTSSKRTATVRCMGAPAEVLVFGRAEFMRIVAESDLQSAEIALLARRHFLASRLTQALPALSARLARGFASDLKLEKVEAGVEILREGDPAETFHVVAAGHVVVVQQTPQGEVLRARLGPGEYFGEMGLMLRKPRSATVRAAEDGAELMTMPREAFTRMIAGSEDVAQVALKRIDELLARGDA